MTHSTNSQPTTGALQPEAPSTRFTELPTGATGVPSPVVIHTTSAGPHPSLHVSARPVGKRRGAWSVWWLSLLTFGIYYVVWYVKVNAELARFAPEAVTVNTALAALSQFVPIVDLVSVANTSKRLNAAAYAIGSPVRISAGMSVLSCFWFFSNTRYLQRRLNGLWDAAQTAVQHAR